jgi:hypothetical protein
MSQDFMQQDTLVNGGGGGFSLTTSYATGTVVPISGTYVAKNKYMDLFVVYGKDEIFGTDATNKKCTWTALNPATTTSKDGGFNSVKVSPGTV